MSRPLAFILAFRLVCPPSPRTYHQGNYDRPGDRRHQAYVHL